MLQIVFDQWDVAAKAIVIIEPCFPTVFSLIKTSRFWSRNCKCNYFIGSPFVPSRSLEKI